MIVYLEFDNKKWQANLSEPIDISIALRNGEDNPNCYWAKPPSFTTIEQGDFIGSVKRGGSVNYKEVSITPHGNGTHTECYGHISSDENATINHLKTINCFCVVITLEPEKVEGDLVLTFENFKKKWIEKPVGAVAIRTLPNDDAKLTKKYSNTNPPYLESSILKFLNEKGIEHVLVDLPSVDKEVDGGKLLGHKAFFGVPHEIRKTASITELIYIDNKVSDGIYYLSNTPLNIELDASPSRPLLYKITSI